MLLRSADVATYHAKNRGGNTYEFFNSTMNSASTRRLTIETRMRRALEREEFSLVYQPIRDTRTGQVSAVEALIRWTDSEGEMIDRSFVSGVGENKSSDEALTSAIVALAKRLEQLVVTEGVETEEQARFLASLGCDGLQGYLFSRPLPPDDLEAYLRREEKDEVAHPRGPR